MSPAPDRKIPRRQRKLQKTNCQSATNSCSRCVVSWQIPLSESYVGHFVASVRTRQSVPAAFGLGFVGGSWRRIAYTSARSCIRWYSVRRRSIDRSFSCPILVFVTPAARRGSARELARTDRIHTD